jgi:selenocysteine lyase/cysteine desulfurase
MDLEAHFSPFRQNIIGQDKVFQTPFGNKKMIYADWIASGRLYDPIEKILSGRIGPFVGNTHAETSENGKRMTHAYKLAHKKIKDSVNASESDVILTTGYGMTGAIVKFQRILGLKNPGSDDTSRFTDVDSKPVVFITHMEHHSNHTSWYETDTDVVIIPPGDDLLVNLDNLELELQKYKNRKVKIGSFTACSNVTGIRTPYHRMASIMHEHGGLAFIDFAASAPYDEINMHPPDPMEKLDAIFFSPHKFLGGPGSSGVLIFDSRLYHSKAPDEPGGGTVDWTNRWGEYKFIDDIEVREDGGTPGFLQAIRAALALELKSQMGPDTMKLREEQLVATAFRKLRKIPGLHILADNIENRLGVISFYISDMHYNLGVRLLSDRFGIQVRGGCACAGTYGHYLLDVSYEKSKDITRKINFGDLSEKPGWIRLSMHPVMTNEDLDFILDAINQIALNHREWSEDYDYDKRKNEFFYKHDVPGPTEVDAWFDLK